MRSSRLVALGRLLGLGDALAEAARLLVDPAEPYELGLALSVSGEQRGVLLSYNPRTRGRDRMLQALAAHGLPVQGARAAMTWLSAERCSTVLGLEWVGGRVEATLYLEELSGSWDLAGVQRMSARVAAAVGLPAPDWGEDPGEPYILALDIAPGGVEALKTYRLASSVGEELARWFPGPEAASGWILQRRHRGSGPAPLKLYKTYAYEQGGGGAEAAEELRALLGGQAEEVVAALAGVPITSIGLRLGPGGIETVTGYWCLARGPGSAGD